MAWGITLTAWGITLMAWGITLTAGASHLRHGASHCLYKPPRPHKLQLYSGQHDQWAEAKALQWMGLTPYPSSPMTLPALTGSGWRRTTGLLQRRSRKKHTGCTTGTRAWLLLLPQLLQPPQHLGSCQPRRRQGLPQGTKPDPAGCMQQHQPSRHIRQWRVVHKCQGPGAPSRGGRGGRS